MSKTLRSAEELEQYAAYYGGAVEQVMRGAASELRRLDAVEQELEALKRAISDAEPVYMVKQAISESTWTQVSRAEYEEAVYFGVVKRTLYTLKGIK